MNAAYNAYKQNSVMTASPAELTLMLYNGAIRFCSLAIEGIEEKNIDKAHTNLLKAQRIISELQATLDPKQEVAKTFSEMYLFINEQLVLANTKKEVQYVETAKRFIVEFRDLWREVMKAA